MITNKRMDIIIACIAALLVMAITFFMALPLNSEIAEGSPADSDISENHLSGALLSQPSGSQNQMLTSDNAIVSQTIKEKDNEAFQKAIKIISKSETLTSAQKVQLRNLGLTDQQITELVKQKDAFLKNNHRTTQDTALSTEWQSKSEAQDAGSIHLNAYIIGISFLFSILLGIACFFFLKKKK